MDTDDLPEQPPSRPRPATAPEREVIRSALGLGRSSGGGEVIRRNRRRVRPDAKPEASQQKPLGISDLGQAPKRVSVREKTEKPSLGELDDLEVAPIEVAAGKTHPREERVPVEKPQSAADAAPLGKPMELPVVKPGVNVAERAAPAKRPQPQPEAKPSAEESLIVQPKERVPRKVAGEILLQTRGLVKVYDGRAVVNGVDINVREQEIVGLLGPNGAGKTTSFYMIVGLVQPNGGHVEFGGNDATNQPMYKRARLGMGYLPQEESIFRKLTVKENIMAVLETQNYSAKERKERCYDLMQRFGIEKLANNIAITLSGGEKRRLTIARSLVTNPKLLMLDEPFSGVDPIAVGEIQDIICDLREQGLAILITDHNVRETLGIVDRAYLIYEGQVLMEGSRDELVSDPEARKLYLGQSFSM